MSQHFLVCITYEDGTKNVYLLSIFMSGVQSKSEDTAQILKSLQWWCRIVSLIFLGQFFPALLGTIGTLGGWQNSNPIGAIFLHLIALIFASFIGYQLCRCSYRRCELIWARGMAHFISCTTSMLHHTTQTVRNK